MRMESKGKLVRYKPEETFASQLFNYIDHIFVIHLFSAKDRRKSCVSQFKKLGIKKEYTLFPAEPCGNDIDKKNWYITQSHLQCLELSKKYKSVMIMEDDFLFINDRSEYLLRSLKSLYSSKIKWDIFHLGDTRWRSKRGWREFYKEKKDINEYLYENNTSWRGVHAYIVRKKSIQKLIDGSNTDRDIPDISWSENAHIHGIHTIHTYKKIVTQQSGHSCRENKSISYDHATQDVKP